MASNTPGRPMTAATSSGFLAANVAYGLDHPELGADFRQALKDASRRLCGGLD
jgi:hypothetical protein